MDYASPLASWNKTPTISFPSNGITLTFAIVISNLPLCDDTILARQFPNTHMARNVYVNASNGDVCARRQAGVPKSRWNFAFISDDWCYYSRRTLTSAAAVTLRFVEMRKKGCFFNEINAVCVSWSCATRAILHDQNHSHMVIDDTWTIRHAWRFKGMQREVWQNVNVTNWYY